MPKRTDKDLGGLFDDTVDTLKKIVTEGESVVTKDGQIVKVPPSAAMLGVVRQFLKDNNITAEPTKHDGLKGLGASLAMPFEVPQDDRDDSNESPAVH